MLFPALVVKILFLSFLIISTHNSHLSQEDLARIEKSLKSTPNDLEFYLPLIKSTRTNLIHPIPLHPNEALISSLEQTPENLLLISSLSSYLHRPDLTKSLNYKAVMDDAFTSNDPNQLLFAFLAHKESNMYFPLEDIKGRITQLVPSLSKPSQTVPALLLCGYLGGLETEAQKLYDKTIKHLLLVDNLLQFRGNLHLTAQFLEAIYQNPSVSPRSQDMVLKLISSVLSAKYSSSPLLLSSLLSAVKVLDSSPSFKPLQLSFLSSHSGLVTLFLGDILARAVPGNNKVTCGSVFLPLGDGRFQGKFSGDFGLVVLNCHVTTEENSTFASSDHVVQFYNFVSVELESPKLTVDTSPKQISQTVEVMSSLSLSFEVSAGSENFRPQQVFVQFHGDGGDITYLPDYLPSLGSFNFKLKKDEAATHFKSHSGLYTMTVLLGDSRMESQISFPIATLKFHFGEEQPVRDRFMPKPLHHHTFREPHKQPPRVVSLVFSLMALLPLPLLLISWLSFGGSIMVSFSSLCFYASFGSILCLYGLYWTHLNMFETLRYLALLSVPVLLSGSRVLRGMALRRKSV